MSKTSNPATKAVATRKRKTPAKRKDASTPLDVAINNVIKFDKAKAKATQKAKDARAELKKLKNGK